jgi:hypothetical protein
MPCDCLVIILLSSFCDSLVLFSLLNCLVIVIVCGCYLMVVLRFSCDSFDFTCDTFLIVSTQQQALDLSNPYPVRPYSFLTPIVFCPIVHCSAPSPFMVEQHQQWSHIQSDGSQSGLHTGHEVSLFIAWHWLVLWLSRGSPAKTGFFKFNILQDARPFLFPSQL